MTSDRRRVEVLDEETYAEYGGHRVFIEFMQEVVMPRSVQWEALDPAMWLGDFRMEQSPV